MRKKAVYKISFSAEEGILEIIVKDKVDEADIEEIHDKITTSLKEKEINNLLVDVRAVKERFSIVEAYSHVRHSLADRLKVKTAIIDLPQNAKFNSFLEITAKNAGRSFKCFTDVDAARDWFKSK